MKVIRYIFLSIILLFLGCKNTINNIPKRQVSILLPSPTQSSTNVIKPALIFKSLKANNVIIDTDSINPLISIDNTGNLSYFGMQLTNYYVLQSSTNLFYWTNNYIFYNQTNLQIDLNKDKEFFRLRVIDATKVHLAWTPSPDSNLVSHINVYYGGESGKYTNFLNVGNTNETIINNLVPNGNYYFALSCVDSNNVESDFSSEANYNKSNLLSILNNYTNSPVTNSTSNNTNNNTQNTNIIVNVNPPINDPIITNGLVYFHKYDGTNIFVVNEPDVNLTEPHGSNDFTAAAWIKTLGSPNNQMIITKSNPTNNEYFYISLSVVGAGANFIIKGYYGGPNALLTGIRVGDDKWHHLALVSSNATLIGYVDGQNRGSIPHQQPINIGTHLQIGSLSTNLYPFQGIIDNVSIYSRALSSDEIIRIYNQN